MAIKEIITLEGVKEVEAQLKQLAATGEKSLKQFSEVGKGTDADPFAKLVDGAKKAGLEIDNTAKSTVKFSDAIRVLRPILQQAGVHLGEISSFGRVAGASMVGFAAAVTGSAGVALFALSEETTRVRQRLTDLFQSALAGNKAFDGLRQSAGNFGTTVKSLLPGFEGFVQAFNLFQERNRTFKFVALDPGDLPAAVGGIDALKQSFDSLFAILRAGGATEDQAKAAIAAFNAEVAKTGQVTGEMVAALLKDAPGALKQLEQALGVPIQNAAALQIALDKTPESFGKFISGLKRVGEESQKAFEARPIQPFTENIKESLSAVERLVQDASDNVNRIGTESKTQIAGVFSELAVDATGTLDTLKTTFAEPVAVNTTAQQTFDQAIALAQSAWQQIQSIFSQPIQIRGQFSGFGGQAEGAPFASGGIVRGRGTSTSDSILAWLSNREFVVNARAVSHYGPDLFAALNAMRLPRDFISRFSIGGLARAISGNKFAAGGQVRSGNPVVLKIDRQSFNMNASDDVIDSLKRFAVASQLSSTGRKPRWVK